MMAKDELKAAEQRGYAKGYAAGQRRKAALSERNKHRREELAFWDRAFLSVAPYFAGCAAWTKGDKQLSSLDDRVELAANFANKAIKKRRFAP